MRGRECRFHVRSRRLGVDPLHNSPHRRQGLNGRRHVEEAGVRVDAHGRLQLAVPHALHRHAGELPRQPTTT